jgi:putative sporulation protein YtaF
MGECSTASGRKLQVTQCAALITKMCREDKKYFPGNRCMSNGEKVPFLSGKAYSAAGGIKMWLWISMILLAFSVSIDSLSVGMSYGMRKVRFPLPSLTLIACMSVVMILISMNIGRLLAIFLPWGVERGLASFILIILGGWAIYNVYKTRQKEAVATEWEDMGQGNAAHSALQVLTKPEFGDLDRSGSISRKEAVWLGLALSMDALGAGISASLLNFPSLPFALLVGLFNPLFIRLGLMLGCMMAETKMMKKATILPGIMLIVLGLIKLFR